MHLDNGQFVIIGFLGFRLEPALILRTEVRTNITMTDADFVRASLVEILVPESSNSSIEEILKAAADKDESALISSVLQRSLLFFGTLLPVVLCHS